MVAIALLLAACAPPARDAVTIALSDDILSLDPNREVQIVTDSVLFNVYEPLVAFDEDLRFRTVLAESWEHPRPEQWRFRLRRGVRFHDGTPLTASAVRDELLALRKRKDSEAAQFLGEVQDIVAVDEHVLDLVTREPRALLANLAALYVTKANATGAEPPLVGTGPFRIREWRRGESVALERWDDYWGGPPALRAATFVPVTDAAKRLELLREERADIAYEVPAEMGSQGETGLRFVHRTGLTVYYLGFDVRPRPDNPFHDPRVRRAFHLAIDRGALVKGPLSGAATVATQPAAPLVFGYNPELGAPPHDTAAARRLLAEAGWATGRRVRLDFSASRASQARFLADAVRSIGVTLDLNPLEGEDVYAHARAGKSALFLVGWNCSTGEAGEFFEFNLHTPGPRYGWGNYGAYSNRRIDEIAERHSAVTDPRDRRRMLQEAAAITMEELPILPLYVADDIYAVREGVRFTPRADGEIRLLDVRIEER